MTRPRVQIDAPNRIKVLRNRLEERLPELERLSEVVGIMLNGGMSRGYADELSEIDLTLYLRPETFAEWEQGQSPVTLGISLWQGQLYDIKIVDYEAERTRKLEGVELWDLSYAEILFDPEGALAQLAREKLAERPNAASCERALFRSWWHWRLAGDIWIHRGDALQGHYILNAALGPLLEALYYVNGEFLPHEKWILHLSRSLEWTPPDWENRIARALGTRDMSLESLQERQAAMGALWEEVERRAREVCAPDLPVSMMQRTYYDLLSWLIERSKVSMGEWQERAARGMLNLDPFHPIVTVVGNEILLDKERLLRIGPEEMYSWQFQVVEAARKEHAA